MLLLVTLLAVFCPIFGAWPEFHDPLLGKLHVSGKRFPFLTQKRAPGRIYIFPTQPQFDAIRAAASGRTKRAALMSFENAKTPPDFDLELEKAIEKHDWKAKFFESQELQEAILSRQRFFRTKRSAEAEDGPPDFGPDSSNSSSLLDQFGSWYSFLAKFLKFEFSMKYLGSETSYDPSTLPFDSIVQDSYVKNLIISERRVMEFLEEDFKPSLLAQKADNRPWLPAEDLARELKTCYYTDYASATDEDLDYDKNVGGEMVFYKLSCVRIRSQLYVGLALYNNKFKLTDIERVERYQETKSYFGGLFKKSKPVVKRWFEKRYISLKELKALRDYILTQVGQHIRADYKEAIASLES